VLDGGVDLALQDRPDLLRHAVAGLGVEVEGIEDRAPDVVLVLVVGTVADADRRGTLVAVEVVQDLLFELLLAGDPVHDLQVVGSLRDVGDEVEEVVGLPVEAECVEAPEGKGRIADPAEAVIPVALAMGRLRQGGGRGGDQGAGGRVGESLQRQGGALQVAAPRMVGEASAGQPVLPVVRGPDQAAVSVLVAGGRGMLAPGHGDEARVAFLEQRPGGGAGSFEAEV